MLKQLSISLELFLSIKEIQLIEAISVWVWQRAEPLRPINDYYLSSNRILFLTNEILIINCTL